MVPGRRDRAHRPPERKMTIYHRHLELGLDLPILPFVVALMKAYEMPLSWWAPNSIPFIMGFLYVCQLVGVKADVFLFCCFFKLIKSERNYTGWFSFQHNPLTGSHTLVLVEKRGEPWRESFFYVNTGGIEVPPWYVDSDPKVTLDPWSDADRINFDSRKEEIDKLRAYDVCCPIPMFNCTAKLSMRMPQGRPAFIRDVDVDGLPMMKVIQDICAYLESAQNIRDLECGPMIAFDMPDGVATPPLSPSSSSGHSGSGSSSSPGSGKDFQDKISDIPEPPEKTEDVDIENATRIELAMHLGGDHPPSPDVVLTSLPTLGGRYSTAALHVVGEGTSADSGVANATGDDMITVSILDPMVDSENSVYYHRIMSGILNPACHGNQDREAKEQQLREIVRAIHTVEFQALRLVLKRC
ncbi:OLC1v1007825C1 [Oldenlandia corymbosa var. corymbosa]|uniref:OLC1v1007825C1 n=1 Tax=Oldenlandia corymbosa var. corymbosa TaxID=529605 RepID=A0AAV1DK30_OLDCO|nr:OLC1v1007825C1 [Oldenlandia corymbosa var. corymbosa]